MAVPTDFVFVTNDFGDGSTSPSGLNPTFIDDSGNAFGNYNSPEIQFNGFVTNVGHQSVEKWTPGFGPPSLIAPVPVPSSSFISYLASILAVSPGGLHTIINSSSAQGPSGDLLDGAQMTQSTPSSGRFVGINDSGRYLYQISWADKLGALQPISGLQPSGIGLGINGGNDILGLKGNGTYGLYTWTPPVGQQPGSYSENILSVTTPAGWMMSSLGSPSTGGTSINDSRLIVGEITQTADSSGNPLSVSQQITAPAVFVPSAMLFDANHDGNIDGNDVGATSAAEPFRLWINDDHDNRNPNVPDYSTGVVNGQSDLKDFFPLALMIQGLVRALPPGQYSYILKQADGALNFTYTNLTTNNAYGYLASQASTGFGTGLSQPVTSATVTQVTSAGVTLDSAFLNQIQGQGGVILVEANAITTNPLVLEIDNSAGGTVAALNLWVSSAFNMQIELLNGTTTDFDGSVVSNIIPSPENPQYANDAGTEGGITVLGPVAMGKGRFEAPNSVYTAPIMAAVQAPLTTAGVQYRWQRLLTRRSWYIKKQKAGDGTISWNVTQRSSRGTVTPANDIDPGFFGNSTPSPAKKEFYEYDDSALLYGNFPNDTAIGFMNIGDYIHEEKAFTYRVQISFDGINWHTQLEMPVAQTITIMYQATGGTAVTDWVGYPNLVNGNTNLNQTIVPTITAAKVSAIVGPIGTVNIDPAANN
jgi:hypothetical protein